MPLLIAAVLTIPTTIVEESHLHAPWPEVATGINWAIWLMFLAEVVIMLVVVPAKGRWLREHPLEFAIVLLTPPALLTAVQPIRLLRLLRVLRVLRLAPLVRVAFSMEGAGFGTPRFLRSCPRLPAERPLPRWRTGQSVTGSIGRSPR